MLAKGDKVGVTGELTNRPWTDKQGNEKYSLELRVSELTLLGTKKDNDSSKPSQPAQSASAPSGGLGMTDEEFDQSIPF